MTDVESQTWTITIRIPKSVVRWHHGEIRRIIENFVDDLERIAKSSQTGKPAIKIKSYFH